MRSINKFSALKTAIANGNKESVRELLAEEPVVELEKSYLVDLAELSGNKDIIELLKEAPIKR